MKNLITYLKTLWSRVADSQRNDRRHDCRLTVGSPSGLDAKWKQNPFMRFAVVFALVFVIGVGNVWGASTTVSWSGGSYSNSTITWSATDICTIYQEQNGAQTAPSSSYVSAPRWYSGNKITITAGNNVSTFTSIVITATTVAYGTTLANSTYNVTGGTGTISTSASEGVVTISMTGTVTAFTIVMDGQSRLSSSSNPTINYTEASPATAHTVTFTKTDGSTQTITEASAGAGVTPPVMSTPCDGWAFQGWSKSESDDDENTDELALVTLTAGKYYPKANTTLYPVYTKDGGTTFSKYEALSTGSTVTNGKYLISTGSYTMAGSGKTGASFSPGTTEAIAKEYTITTLGRGVFTIKGPDNKYIGGKDANDGLLFDSSTPSTNAYKWKYPTNGIQNQSYTSRYIRAYGTTDFRHYSTSNGTQAKLYKRVETTITYYYSYPNCCTPLGTINGSINLNQKSHLLPYIYPINNFCFCLYQISHYVKDLFVPF